jgi:hypothetical protein
MSLLLLLLLLHAQATIAPSAANVNTVNVSRGDFVTFIGVQQWLAQHLQLELQLLAGTFVLVPAHDIPLLGMLPHLF